MKENYEKILGILLLRKKNAGSFREVGTKMQKNFGAMANNFG